MAKDAIHHGKNTENRSGKETVEKEAKKEKVWAPTIRVKEKERAAEMPGMQMVLSGKTTGDHGDLWRVIGNRKGTIRVGPLRKVTVPGLVEDETEKGN